MHLIDRAGCGCSWAVAAEHARACLDICDSCISPSDVCSARDRDAKEDELVKSSCKNAELERRIVQLNKELVSGVELCMCLHEFSAVLLSWTGGRSALLQYIFSEFRQLYIPVGFVYARALKHAYTHVHVHAHPPSHTQTHTHSHARMQSHALLHTHTHKRTHTHTQAHMNTLTRMVMIIAMKLQEQRDATILEQAKVLQTRDEMLDEYDSKMKTLM